MVVRFRMRKSLKYIFKLDLLFAVVFIERRGMLRLSGSHSAMEISAFEEHFWTFFKMQQNFFRFPFFHFNMKRGNSPEFYHGKALCIRNAPDTKRVPLSPIIAYGINFSVFKRSSAFLASAIQ